MKGQLFEKHWTASITLCALILLLASSRVGWSEPRLIVAADSSVDQMNVHSARAIFSMRVNQWPDGNPVVVFVLPDHAMDHRAFTKKVLSMFPHQLRRSWDRYQYSGTGMPPIQVQSAEDMLKKVVTTPGAIGYLDERFLNDDVRAISVY